MMEIPLEMQEQFCRNIAKGMDFLHSKGVVHRDLSCRNVLLTASLTAKVGDFGMSRLIEKDRSDQYQKGTRSVAGPIRWMAPECLREKTYGKSSDVYAFGMTVIEMCIREPPFPEEKSVVTLGMKLSEGKINAKVPSEVPKSVSQIYKKKSNII